jgi:hypothetical protein
MEIWKDIENYFGLYQVSNLGNVKSVKRNIILKPDLTNKGYHKVCLYKNRISKWELIHRLVLETFIPNPLNLPQTNHKNGIKIDNCVENLEWCDNSYNQLHSIKFLNKKFNPVFGESNHLSKLTEIQVQEIRAKYIPIKYSSIKLGKEYGVSGATIRYIISNKTWKHVSPATKV